MTKKKETIDPIYCYTPEHVKRISWSAIFIGAIVGVGLMFLLNLFGLAIGLSAVSASTGGAYVLATGGLLGIIISIVASTLVAGYAAGYLGRFHCPKRNLGIVYGFASWTVALILTAVIATHLTAYITAYTNAISHSAFVSTASTEVKATVSPSGLAWGAFSVFVLFFIGAFSSCLGACLGMHCRRED